MHRLDVSLYCHPKEFWGNGVGLHVNSKGKIPSMEAQRRVEPTTLNHAGHKPKTLPTELFRPPTKEASTPQAKKQS